MTSTARKTTIIILAIAAVAQLALVLYYSDFAFRLRATVVTGPPHEVSLDLQCRPPEDLAPGTYNLLVEATDRLGSPVQKVIKVNVVEPNTLAACGDSIDNDGDGAIDIADIGCTDANDSSEHTADNACQQNNLLANGSFEDAVTITGSVPTAPGFWDFDPGEITSQLADIVPLNGNSMWHFTAAGRTNLQRWVASNLWQLVPLPEGVQAGDIIEAEAFFNRIAGDSETDSRFDLIVRAYDFPMEQFTDSRSDTDYTAELRETVITDGQTATWERAQGTLEVPAGTVFIGYQVTPLENIVNDAEQPEFDGHVADQACLHIIKQAPPAEVTVCHKETGQPDVTLKIAETAVSAHLDHGDTEGACSEPPPPTPPPSYSAYCGDGTVNQEWEQCDGGTNCTERCQPSNNSQCTDQVFARVVVDDDVQNTGAGNATSDIYLGSATNKIPTGAWFLLHQNDSYVQDGDMTSNNYENVPGLAVERRQQRVRLLLRGTHPSGTGQEHVRGHLEFFGAAVASLESDNSGNNKIERPDDGQMTINADQDEIWRDGSEPNKSFFWLTVTTADDGYFTTYTNPQECEQPAAQCSDGIDNDNDGAVDGADSGCHADGNPNNPASYLPDRDNEHAPDAECSDNVDNDGDGLVDGADPQCHTDGDPTNAGSYDRTREPEAAPKQCSDGIDNDGDIFVDSADSGCHTDGNPNNPASYDPNRDSEGSSTLTQCSDSIDNDDDSLVDGGDPQCHTDGNPLNPNSYDPSRDTEQEPAPTPRCSDGEDNDGDGAIDAADSGCHTDGDPNNPASYDPDDQDEGGNTLTQCSDNIDNDGDSLIDGGDPQCHTDGAADNPGTYDPTRDDESEPTKPEDPDDNDDGDDGGEDGDGGDEEESREDRTYVFQAEVGHQYSRNAGGPVTDQEREVLALYHHRDTVSRSISIPEDDYWLSITAKHDRPGPVDIGIYVNGVPWQAVKLNVDDNNYRTHTVGRLRNLSNATISFRFLQDRFEGYGNDDIDRNMYIDFWTLRGVRRAVC